VNYAVNPKVEKEALSLNILKKLMRRNINSRKKSFVQINPQKEDF